MTLFLVDQATIKLLAVKHTDDIWSCRLACFDEMFGTAMQWPIKYPYFSYIGIIKSMFQNKHTYDMVYVVFSHIMTQNCHQISIAKKMDLLKTYSIHFTKNGMV